MRPLRIALLHPYSWPDVRRGGERYLGDLAWYLDRAGHVVEVITGGASGARRAAGSDDGPVRRIVRNPRPARLERRGVSQDETFAVRAILPLLRRRYDVVHALTPAAAVASRLAGHRTIYTVLGHPAPELISSFPRPQRAVLARAVRRATVVAALSAAAAGAVEASFGRSARVLSPGVRLDRFPPGLEPRSGPARILFPSFASNPHKGLETLLDAFARVLGRLPGARLELRGPGDARWALDRVGPEARAAIDAGDVGPVEGVPAMYRRATVTVLPSIHEAFGLVLVESLACGTPVVCSSTSGGMPEIVDRPEIGRTAPYGNPAALAHALEEVVRLAADPATPARCREHAARWEWSSVIGPAHEDLYREVAHGGGTRRFARAGRTR